MLPVKMRLSHSRARDVTAALGDGPGTGEAALGEAGAVAAEVAAGDGAGVDCALTAAGAEAHKHAARSARVRTFMLRRSRTHGGPPLSTDRCAFRISALAELGGSWNHECMPHKG